MDKESVSATEDSGLKPLAGDNPIKEKERDALERAGVAENFVRQALELDATEGATVGIFGQWGSGKTSFVNLACKEFENSGVTFLKFNPWLFSGAEELVPRFFGELSSSMGMQGKHIKRVGNAFRKYGSTLSSLATTAARASGFPIIGPLLEEIKIHFSQPKSIGTVRTKVENALLNYFQTNGKPIIVVLDDVDRLSTPEIREVFKLVRLTANFPYLIYIVCCDRVRIEKALDEDGRGLSGSDYLEKIVQFPFNLPEVPRHLLLNELDAAIENALSGMDYGKFHQDDWLDISEEIVRPFIRNMRDVRRYAMTIQETVRGLKGQVALEDVLALESVRVFCPHVFRQLPGAIESLTVTSRATDRFRDSLSPLGSSLHQWLKTKLDNLIQTAEADPVKKEVTSALIGRLFPVGFQLLQPDSENSSGYVNDNKDEHLRERRVAHENILRLYLERVVSPDLMDLHDAEQALGLMTDRDELDRFIRTLEKSRWHSVLRNLITLSGQLNSDHAWPGIVTFLNLWPDMPEEPAGSGTSTYTRITIRQLTKLLLETLEPGSGVEMMVRRILPEINSPSSRLLLITLTPENTGDPAATFFPDKVNQEMKEEFLEQINSKSPEEIAEWHDLYPVLEFAKNHSNVLNQSFEIPDSPKLTFALILSVRGRNDSGVLGRRAVKESVGLDLNRLVDLYGCKRSLNRNICNLKRDFEELRSWIENKISFHEANQFLNNVDSFLSEE